ncbi:MAG: organomercurial lyase [Anaerolineae bacterium]
MAALLRDAGTIDLHGNEARLFVQTVRHLTQGQPLTEKDIEEIAIGLSLTPEKANDVLKWLAERNDDGEIVGIAGLSLNPWNHGFRVSGRDFTTWCALDTLYLPQIIRQDVEISSADPISNETVQFKLGADGELDVPEDTVISIVVPKIDQQGLESAEQIWSAFCSYSHYFTTEENGRAWFEGKQIEPVFLSVAEGIELGQKWFAQVIRYA